jgi:hydrogenase maturation protein HypF
MHPRYETTKWAEFFSEERNIPLLKVQHHYAHILSCMAENGVEDEVLGIAWDGTGYGEDGTLWGGEFLVCSKKSRHRKSVPFGRRYAKRCIGKQNKRRVY